MDTQDDNTSAENSLPVPPTNASKKHVPFKKRTEIKGAAIVTSAEDKASLQEWLEVNGKRCSFYEASDGRHVASKIEIGKIEWVLVSSERTIINCGAQDILFRTLIRNEAKLITPNSERCLAIDLWNFVSRNFEFFHCLERPEVAIGRLMDIEDSLFRIVAQLKHMDWSWAEYKYDSSPPVMGEAISELRRATAFIDDVHEKQEKAKLSVLQVDLLEAASFTERLKAKDLCARVKHCNHHGNSKVVLSSLVKLGYLKSSRLGYLRLR